MTGDKVESVRPRWLLLLLIVGIGLAYLIAMGIAGEGRPVAPLDDSYIFYQYARQIARGHPWRYNDGDPASTGMTSLLYPWLLAGLYALGVQGERLALFAVASGVLWLGGIAFWTLRVWDALGVPVSQGRRWGMIAALAVLATGLVQWGAFVGMETGLFTVLLLAALDALLRRQIRLAGLWLGLAGLTRPEGQILAFLALLVYGGLQARASIDKPLTVRSILRLCGDVIPLGLAVAVSVLPSVLNGLVSGTFASSGLQAKSWFYNVPLVWGDALRSVGSSYWRVFVRVLNGWGAPSRAVSGNLVTPGLSVLAGMGWVALAVRRRWFPLLLTASWFWLGTLSTATLITATWHLGRYQAPFIPLAIILAVVGISVMWEGANHRWHWRRLLAGCLLIGLLVGALFSTGHALAAFRRAARTVARQQLPLADWLRTNLPLGTRVGVHDTGSLRYVGERPTYDLIGLTTAETTLAWRHGAGSVFEQMEHSPLRPDYFAIYPDAFSIPYLAATDLFARELFRVEVPDHAVASAGPVQGVWQADWRLAGSGERFYQPDILRRTRGLTLVDTLDAADLGDEAAHRFHWWHQAQRSGFPTEVYQMTYRVDPEAEVLDGGRLVTGGMSFQVQTQPGEPLWIVARLHAQQAGVVQVTVDGQAVGRWAYPPLLGEWLETVFVIPAGAVVSEQSEISLQVDTADPGFRHYAPYYFWFLQGEPQEEPTVIPRSLDVAFGPGIRLLGFDLEQPDLHPGEPLSLTLYWQVDSSVESAARVFVHLYDAQGQLGPQTDGWAGRGTRPPYTWAPGEVISDSRLIVLPPDLPLGPYTLEVGLYDDEGRLPASASTIGPFTENRVPLAEIEVSEP